MYGLGAVHIRLPQGLMVVKTTCGLVERKEEVWRPNVVTPIVLPANHDNNRMKRAKGQQKVNEFGALCVVIWDKTAKDV